MESLLKLPINELAKKLKNKEVSPIEITEVALSKADMLNKKHNIFITILHEEALADAKKSEQEILNGHYRGPLHGIPISIKDNVDVKDSLCTNGSFVDKSKISMTDAIIVQKLQHGGAIITGKTNMDEYANHVTGINKHYGVITNPANPDYIVGGSSGGSATAVASHLSYGSIGTDTSGSVRIPAANTDIYGLKLSHNLVPSNGIQPLSWSLDHVGIFARNCDDLTTMFRGIIPGINIDKPGAYRELEIRKLKIGVIENYFFDHIDSEVELKVKDAIKNLVNHGATLENIKIENLREKISSQEIIIGAESALIHRKNIRAYGDQYEQFNYEYFKEGLNIKSTQYMRALRSKQILTQEISEFLSTVDIIITPTLPMTAPKLPNKNAFSESFGEELLKRMSMYTGPFNITGLPALSIPVGKDRKGLPIGLQVVGKKYEDANLISIAQLITKLL